MTQSGIYSENKLVWWYAREQELPAAPKQVQLILSDMCNQDCSFCAYRMSGYSSNELFMGDSEPSKLGTNNPKRWIPTERALSLLDEFKEAGVLSVQFTGGGEPTVHPDHEAIFARALDLGLRCSLVFNGIRWSKNLTENILPQFDWVRVSIDAATSDEYVKIRRTHGSHWGIAWGHAHELARNINYLETPCTFGLGFVVTPESWKGIAKFAELAKASGAHNVRYTAMFSTDNEKPFTAIYDQVRVLLDKAKRLSSDTFDVYDNFGSRFDDLQQHAPDYSFCSYQHYTAYVGGDLQLYRCCVLAYNKRGIVKGGDLTNRSFSEFWASQERKDDFNGLDARNCDRCQFNSKNRSLLYVMGNTESDTQPRHLEWP